MLKENHMDFEISSECKKNIRNLQLQVAPTVMNNLGPYWGKSSQLVKWLGSPPQLKPTEQCELLKGLTNHSY